MLKEELVKQIMDSKSKNILLEFATGTGKTKIALDKCHQLWNKDKSILIVVPRNVLKENWEKEISLWGYATMLSNIEIITYTTFIKGNHTGDIIIFDEAHHLSEKCLDVAYVLRYENAILLSASVSRNKRAELCEVFHPEIFFLGLKKAISNNILPDPKVYLIEMHLDNKVKSELIVKNASKSFTIKLDFKDRFKKYPNNRVEISCTQKEYYSYLESLTQYYSQFKYTQYGLTKYLRTAGDRTKYLSHIKEPYILHILDVLKEERTLTFCKDIAQTEILGKNAVNSKNKNSEEILNKFNNGEINHITTCNMLDEGCNLTDCKYGIYAFLNSSEKMIIQKTGRLLRHSSPVLIIPYFAHTREEELVQKMCENYNNIIKLKANDF
jgi:superfamily II DNA or RNA helicase